MRHRVAAARLAIVVAVFVWIAGCAGGIDVVEREPSVAESEFQTVVARFEGQRPILEIPEPREVRSDALVAEPGVRQPAAVLCALGWDPQSRKVYQANIPAWYVWVRHGGRLTMLGLDVNMDYADFARLGQGPVAEYRAADGKRALVWLE